MQIFPPQEIPKLQMADDEEGFQECTDLHPPILMLLTRHPLLTTANSGSRRRETCSRIQCSRSSGPGTDLSPPYWP